MVWFRGWLGWQGLLTALVGMAASGGLVWLVRIIGTVVLRREAMGFGDVTLMAMIGAYLGWQPCLVVFFLAPLAGLMVGVLRLILSRDREIPYGPFLCLATLFLIVRWRALGLHAGHFLAGLVRAVADALLPGADGPDAVRMAAHRWRIPLIAGRFGHAHPWRPRRIDAVKPLDVVPMKPRGQCGTQPHRLNSLVVIRPLATSHSSASLCFSRAISSSTAEARMSVPRLVLGLDSTYFTARKLGNRRG